MPMVRYCKKALTLSFIRPNTSLLLSKYWITFNVSLQQSACLIPVYMHSCSILVSLHCLHPHWHQISDLMLNLFYIAI